MTTYTDVFGSATLPPSSYGYQALSITSNTTLVWPYNATGGTAVSKIIDLTATAGLSLTFPDATLVSTGEDCLIRNVGAETVTIKDSAGGTITTVAASAAKYLYLTDNSTAAGTWGVVAFGVGSSNADAASLVGYGLMASGATLNVASPVNISATGVTIDGTYRGKTFVFTGGADTLALTAVATIADNFFVLVKNNGTGTLTINPDGAELIDGTSTLGLQPGESLILVCSGAAWYTVGYGRAVLYQFSQLVKDVSAAGTITLTASEASNKLLTFTGNPASDLNIVVPNTVAVYYTQSAISTAKTITVKTAAGTGTAIPQSQRIVMICDGTNVVGAQSAAATANLTYLDGSAVAPSANFASSTNSGFFLKGATGVGVAANGVEIGSFETTGLELVAPLAVTEGGTGRATSTTAYGLIAAGTTATGAQQTLAAGATTEMLVGGGAAALPVWTAATGSGSPVRATSPTLVTPVLGVATATSINTIYVKSSAGIGIGATGILIVGGVATGANVTTSAIDSTVVGNGAGQALTSGVRNTFVGANAGVLVTTGTENTFVGASTGATTGNRNTVVGASAAASSMTGNNNVVIGANSGSGDPESPPYIGSGSNNILVGAGINPSTSNVSNEITLGDSSIATLRCQVTSITALSDARDKTDVAPLTTGLSTVMALNPVRFTWNMRDGGKVGVKDSGFIAQDLQIIDDEWLRLVYAENPEKLEASYGRLMPVLVKAIQELNAKIEALTNAR